MSSTWDEISPVYSTTITYTLSEFYKLLNLEYQDNLVIEILEKTTTGRIKKIKINNKELTANYICSKLSLNSTYFEIIQDGSKVIIKNKGYGHGVGMSQYGANYFAKQGLNYKEILEKYYTGISVSK